MIDIIRLSACLFFLSLACITDIKYRKIRNWNVLALAILGIVLNFSEMGIKSVPYTLIGGFSCIALTIPLYSLRMLGAGDIKLFGALGMVFGVLAGIKILLYSFLAGGLIAFIYMVINKNFKRRFEKLYSYIKVVFISGKLDGYQDFNDTEKGANFAFSLAILAGWGIYIFETIDCLKDF